MTTPSLSARAERHGSKVSILGTLGEWNGNPAREIEIRGSTAPGKYRWVALRRATHSAHAIRLNGKLYAEPARYEQNPYRVIRDPLPESELRADCQVARNMKRSAWYAANGITSEILYFRFKDYGWYATPHATRALAQRYDTTHGPSFGAFEIEETL